MSPQSVARRQPSGLWFGRFWFGRSWFGRFWFGRSRFEPVGSAARSGLSPLLLGLVGLGLLVPAGAGAQTPGKDEAEASAAEASAEAAAEPQADSRVRKILDELELSYDVDEDADFKLIFEVDDDRTQVAWVISATEEYRELEVREIWSFAYEIEGGNFPGPVANMLLEDTFDKKLGAWTKIGERAAFVTRLPADADAETFYSTLLITLDVADEMERRLTPDLDEF